MAVRAERNAVIYPVTFLDTKDVVNIQKAGEVPLLATASTLTRSGTLQNGMTDAGISPYQ
ncbi:hypothetical protein PGPR2_13195 [Pseudomonas aeruginosa PGPR2]|nr:hypothetical protein PGPR2_13195 [Pseudomonas aeruginosa PGPR2]